LKLGSFIETKVLFDVSVVLKLIQWIRIFFESKNTAY